MIACRIDGIVDLDNDFEDDYFATKNGRMHYRHHEGPGKKIILIHGFAVGMKSWSKMIHYLPDSLDVFAIDLLGHGLSDAPDIEYSVKMHYDTLLEFVRSNLDLDPVLFGHSYGGWLAAYYSVHNRIDGLVIEDTVGLPEIVEERDRDNPTFKKDMIKNALTMNPREHVLDSMFHANNKAAFLTPKELGRISCRTLIIWGAGDKTVDTKYSKVFNSGIRKSRLEIIADAKHTPHYSNPQQVANLFLDFIKQ